MTGDTYSFVHPEIRNPLTWRAVEGAGNGPWFDCGPARETGEVWAREFAGSTWLCWDPALQMWAETVHYYPADGEHIDIHGFAWTVRWSEAEAAKRDRWIADQRNDEAWEPQEVRASLVQGRAAA